MLPTVPPGQDPTKVTIASQIPTAGETVKSGQPVQVFLVPPPKPPPTKHTGPKKLAVRRRVGECGRRRGRRRAGARP